MGILNRTVDSFYDGGRYYALDAFLRQAERLVADGADILDIGARSAGVGTRRVAATEETDLVAESVGEVVRRFDVPVSVDTWRGAVVAAGFEAGAVMGNDLSGFSDLSYLPAAAEVGASVVATHIRRPPGIPDPDPCYDDVVGDVCHALAGLSRRAMRHGIAADRIVLDPGLDLGKSWRQSLDLLAACDRLAALGHPVLVAPSNKIFLGRLLDAPKDQREIGTAAACAAAVLLGARIIRVHDARVGRHAGDVISACLRRRL